MILFKGTNKELKQWIEANKQKENYYEQRIS